MGFLWLLFALDSSHAASNSHDANVVFVTVMPTAKPINAQGEVIQVQYSNVARKSSASIKLLEQKWYISSKMYFKDEKKMCVDGWKNDNVPSYYTIDNVHQCKQVALYNCS